MRDLAEADFMRRVLDRQAFAAGSVRLRRI
jgi:hypothetical protein